MASTLEKKIDQEKAKEQKERERKAREREEEVRKRPTVEAICRLMFPSIFDGEWTTSREQDVGGWDGILFYVRKQPYTLTGQTVHIEGTPTEGYSSYDSWVLILSRGWNIKQLTSFSIADKYSAEVEQELVGYIKRDLERSWRDR
jgi:hypothetical protein